MIKFTEVHSVQECLPSSDLYIAQVKPTGQ